MSEQDLFSQGNVERIQKDAGDAVRRLALEAQIRANMADRPLLRGGAQLPKLPDFPDIFTQARIYGRFAEEAFGRANAIGAFTAAVSEVMAGSLFRDTQTMIGAGASDPRVVGELQNHLGKHAMPDCSTLQIGVHSAAKAILGYGFITGVAIPLREGSKVKWFSGLEGALGAIVSLDAVAVSFGLKKPLPHELTGSFYGAHGSLHLGAGFGLNIFFNTRNLEFEGASVTAGIGVGFGIAVLVGAELVTSD